MKRRDERWARARARRLPARRAAMVDRIRAEMAAREDAYWHRVLFGDPRPPGSPPPQGIMAFMRERAPTTATEVMAQHEERERQIYVKHGVCPYCKRRPLAPGEWARACTYCIVASPILGAQDANGLLEWIKERHA